MDGGYLIGAAIAGGVSGGTVLLYLLKSKVSKREADLCRRGIHDRIQSTHKQLHTIRRATALIIQKLYAKNNGDMAGLIEALIEELNGDE